MPTFQPSTVAEQLADYLRQAIENRQWDEMLPSASTLASDLGVNHKTVEAALRQLEHLRLVENLGPGRGRKIIRATGRGKNNVCPLHFAYLFYDETDSYREYAIKVISTLEANGHTVSIAPETISGMNFSIKRIKSLVRKIPADAWIVVAGPRDVLEWFSEQPMPVFALFGRRENLPIPSIGPDYRVAHAAAIKHLIQLGHRRIVLLNLPERRLPQPGIPERAFLDELRNMGIPANESYNLPDWDGTPAGLLALVDSLYRVTPPTAFIVDEPRIYLGLQQILSANGLHAPRDVSLICTEKYPLFDWSFPSLAHYQWNLGMVASSVLRWASAIGKGQAHTKQVLAPVEYMESASVGPAPSHQPKLRRPA